MPEHFPIANSISVIKNVGKAGQVLVEKCVWKFGFLLHWGFYRDELKTAYPSVVTISSWQIRRAHTNVQSLLSKASSVGIVGKTIGFSSLEYGSGVSISVVRGTTAPRHVAFIGLFTVLYITYICSISRIIEVLKGVFILTRPLYSYERSKARIFESYNLHEVGLFYV